MAPPSLRRPRRIRRLAAAALLLLICGGAYGFVSLGTFLAREDPLVTADAIFVLAGTLAERPLEAADLYKEGRAPAIVVTRARSEDAARDLEKLGVRVPTQFDLTRDVLVHVGIPERALITPARVHDATAEEAETLRDLAVARGWRRVIVVTSKYHLRRTRLASRRALSGTGVEIVMRASRYDTSTPERWWTTRRDIRWVVSEVPKLVAYALGLGM